MARGDKRIVVTDMAGYPQIRNFLALPMERYQVIRRRDLFKAINFVHAKLRGRAHEFFLNMFLDLSRADYWDLLHFFNTISTGNRPWITTFETFVPRYANAYKFGVKYGVKRLASDSCRQLIAISECTRHIQMAWLDRYPDYRAAIGEKIVVVPPSQKLKIVTMADKVPPGETIRFTIVGADFFRKGGGEVLRVFDRLLQDRLPVELNIVSTMQYGDYASKTTEHDLKEAMKIIGKYPDQIHYHPRLTNFEVLNLFLNTDVGLLPTWADTYGYSVLEAQATGCPMITTDIRALPEINSPDWGWLIPVPRDYWNNGRLGTEEQQKAFSKAIERGLEESIRGILEHPEVILEKGSRALDRIRHHHDPLKLAARMEEIYDRALEGR